MLAKNPSRTFVPENDFRKGGLDQTLANSIWKCNKLMLTDFG